MARSPELARLFQRPDLPAQRHYETCRAYFHESTPADEIAQRFDLHVGSARAIVRDFARDPDLNAFFATARPGRKTSPKRDAIHQRACELRRQGATLADIRAALQRGHRRVVPTRSWYEAGNIPLPTSLASLAGAVAARVVLTEAPK